MSDAQQAQADILALSVAVLKARAAVVDAGGYDETIDQLRFAFDDAGGDIRAFRKGVLDDLEVRRKVAQLARKVESETAHRLLNDEVAMAERVNSRELDAEAEHLELKCRVASSEYQRKFAALTKTGLTESQVLAAIGPEPDVKALTLRAQELRHNAEGRRQAIRETAQMLARIEALPHRIATGHSA
jgi:hypothetical protein